MKNKIINFLKEPVLYLMIIIIAIQITLYNKVPEYSISGDSEGYTKIYNKDSIFHGYVSNSRTPVYPYFIKLIKKIGGEQNLNINVAIAQKILFVLAILLFYYTLRLMIKNKIIICALTVIFGISPTILLWNIFVLTESISILEMTFLAYITIKYLKKPSKIIASLMGITILMMILTKPSFIYLLPIYVLFIILRFIINKEERKVLFFAIASIVICCIVLIMYCMQMKKYYGEFQLTDVSTDNNIITAICTGAYKDSENRELIKEIEDYVGEEASEGETFDILHKIKVEYSTDELKSFADSALRNNPKYMNFLINKFIDLASKNIGISYINAENSDKNAIFDYNAMGVLLIPITFGMVYMILIISIGYLIWYIIKYRKINWICAFFTSTIFANIFTLIFGAPFEEQRLFFPSMCLVLLYIGVIIEKIKLKEEKLLNEKNIK